MASDWHRLDNQPAMSGADMKNFVVDYTNGIVKGLEGSMNNAVPSQQGGKKSPQPQKSDKKVKIGNRELCIYVGSRGGKYVRIDGKFVPLKDARKRK